jgi:putative ABC transport system substrate-binding protein
MTRREFIVLIGGAAAWPLAARAQQPIGKIRHLGVLLPGLPTSSLGKATGDRLRELGYTEGRTLSSKLDGRRERLIGLLNWQPN